MFEHAYCHGGGTSDLVYSGVAMAGLGVVVLSTIRIHNKFEAANLDRSFVRLFLLTSLVTVITLLCIAATLTLCTLKDHHLAVQFTSMAMVLLQMVTTVLVLAQSILRLQSTWDQTAHKFTRRDKVKTTLILLLLTAEIAALTVFRVLHIDSNDGWTFMSIASIFVVTDMAAMFVVLSLFQKKLFQHIMDSKVCLDLQEELTPYPRSIDSLRHRYSLFMEASVRTIVLSLLTLLFVTISTVRSFYDFGICALLWTTDSVINYFAVYSQYDPRYYRKCCHRLQRFVVHRIELSLVQRILRELVSEPESVNTEGAPRPIKPDVETKSPPHSPLSVISEPQHALRFMPTYCPELVLPVTTTSASGHGSERDQKEQCGEEGTATSIEIQCAPSSGEGTRVSVEIAIERNISMPPIEVKVQTVAPVAGRIEVDVNIEVDEVESADCGQSHVHCHKGGTSNSAVTSSRSDYTPSWMSTQL